MRNESVSWFGGSVKLACCSSLGSELALSDYVDMRKQTVRWVCGSVKLACCSS